MTKESEAWQPRLQNPEPRSHLVRLVQGNLSLPTSSPPPPRKENEACLSSQHSATAPTPTGEQPGLCSESSVLTPSLLLLFAWGVCVCVTKLEPGSTVFHCNLTQ